MKARTRKYLLRRNANKIYKRKVKRAIYDLLPKRTSLIYIDYRDKFENLKSINEAVQQNSYQPLFEDNDEWASDQEHESINYLKKELKSDLANHLQIDKDEAEELIEKHDDYIQDLCYTRDDSNYIKDLARNTSDVVFFYDTCKTLK